MKGHGANGETVSFVAGSFVGFEDRSFRWFDIKRFSIVASDAPDEVILAAVIGHPQYRDHYTSPDSQSDTGTSHGPYLLSRIHASSFEKCSRERGRETMRAFCNLDEVPPPQGLGDDLEDSVFGPIATASVIFELTELDGAQHEFGWVLDEFRELVVISSDRSEVILMVAAID